MSTNNAIKFFVVSYTNKVKDYCATEFFKRFNEIATGHMSLVVDNTIGREYFEEIAHLTPYVARVEVPAEPKASQFQRNVAESVQLCREKFLESDADVMVIIESDVIPPADLLTNFSHDIWHLGQCGEFGHKPWGILGGLYYNGFHDYSLDGLEPTGHVLSGCTAYRRELLEKYPFRYDPNNLGPFPDALICLDSMGEYSLWNDHRIVCKHVELQPGCRQSSSL